MNAYKLKWLSAVIALSRGKVLGTSGFRLSRFSEPNLATWMMPRPGRQERSRQNYVFLKDVNPLPSFPRGTPQAFKALYGFTFLAAAALYALVQVNLPVPPPARANEIGIFCAIIVAIVVIVWLVAYTFALFWHRDLFDTEPFTLEKRKLDQSKGQHPMLDAEETEKPEA